MAKFIVNLNPGETAESVDKSKVPSDGWHKAKLLEVGTTDDGDCQLKFEVTHGADTGSHVSAFLKDPGNAVSDDDVKKARDKMLMYASRLGVFPQGQGAVGIDFDAAIGRPVVLEVETRHYTDKKTGLPAKYTGLSYAGVFPPDHPRIPVKVRKDLALPPARPAGGAGGNGHQNGAPAQAATPDINL